jgi:xylan 1,4-beta-xylosidase
LEKLGNQLISSGDGYYVTKSETGYQIMLYHYCHFDKLYCMNFNTNISLEQRYDVFINTYNKEFTFTLKGLESGTYSIKRHVLNQQYGSAFDRWVDMGAPKTLTAEETLYLKHISIPNQHMSEVSIEGSLVITADLAPHEVRLYEVVPKRR